MNESRDTTNKIILFIFYLDIALTKKWGNDIRKVMFPAWAT